MNPNSQRESERERERAHCLVSVGLTHQQRRGPWPYPPTGCSRPTTANGRQPDLHTRSLSCAPPLASNGKKRRSFFFFFSIEPAAAAPCIYVTEQRKQRRRVLHIDKPLASSSQGHGPAAAARSALHSLAGQKAASCSSKGAPGPTAGTEAQQPRRPSCHTS